MAGPYIKQYTEEGTKSKKTGKTPEYTVSLKENGFWECSCMAWINTVPNSKGDRDQCKHITRRIIKLMQKGEELTGVPTAKTTPIVQKIEQQHLVRSISFEDL